MGGRRDGRAKEGVGVVLCLCCWCCGCFEVSRLIGSGYFVPASFSRFPFPLFIRSLFSPFTTLSFLTSRITLESRFGTDGDEDDFDDDDDDDAAGAMVVTDRREDVVVVSGCWLSCRCRFCDVSGVL